MARLEVIAFNYTHDCLQEMTFVECQITGEITFEIFKQFLQTDTYLHGLKFADSPVVDIAGNQMI